MLVFLYPSKRITQTYILLGIRQALPFLCHLGSDILDSHVFEVSCAGSFVEVQKVSRSGALDQSVVIKKRNRSVLNSRKSAAGLVCLLDLQRGVRFNPCFVGGLVGSSVGFRLRSKLLSSSVSGHKETTLRVVGARTSFSSSLIALAISAAALNASLPLW